MPRVIHLHVEASPKPAEGAPCNGCGACCAAEPCPLGMVASRRRHGACAALHWHADEARYRCGLIAAPLLARAARRMVEAGSGCDFAAELEAAGASGSGSDA